MQGEGPQVGLPTLFVRTAGCPLRCSYCDTVDSYRASKEFGVRSLDGAMRAVLSNPCSVESLLNVLFEPMAVNPSLPSTTRVPWLSLTGGEPTLWPDFGREVFLAAQRHGMRTQLESAGQDVELLRALLPVCDFYSMDWKLPSTLSPREDHSVAHLSCLDAALEEGVRSSVKVVLVPDQALEEWRDCLLRLRVFGRRIRLVLQPVTASLHVKEGCRPEFLRARLGEAMDAGFDVQLLPQIHPYLGLA